MPDEATLKFYADNAADYVRHRDAPTPQLSDFLAWLPPGARILELGSGNGRDAAAMQAAGFEVTPSDASAQLAARAEALLGRAVRIMAFHELDEVAYYEGVWACAALLHAPRSELTDDFARIHRALKPGGHFVASFKAGDEEGRDGLGRYYNYLSATALQAHLADAGPWSHIRITQNNGSGYDDRPTEWLWVHAIKPDLP